VWWDLLLPVLNFMLTFTLPTALQEAHRSQQTVFFNVPSCAPTTAARGPHIIGRQLGLVGVLHTWGRYLADRPRIH
jgi:hypothetical protein